VQRAEERPEPADVTGGLLVLVLAEGPSAIVFETVVRRG
jgi:hypothetical protein